MKEHVRKLTEHEFGLLKPELETYIEGRKAQDRLTRMLGLFAPGCDLDLQTLTLTREVPDPAPAEPPADEAPPATSE